MSSPPRNRQRGGISPNDRSISPPRRRIQYSSPPDHSQSPPRRQPVNRINENYSPPRQRMDESSSPPRRRRIVERRDDSHSPPPPHRRVPRSREETKNDDDDFNNHHHHRDRSFSPPRRNSHYSPYSPSPPRQRRIHQQQQQPQQRRDDSQSPPRRQPVQKCDDNISQSPPRRGPLQQQRKISQSPPRRITRRELSPSPPRNKPYIQNDQSQSPPRQRRVREISESPPPPRSSSGGVNRVTQTGGQIRPRQRNISPTPSPPRKIHKDNQYHQRNHEEDSPPRTRRFDPIVENDNTHDNEIQNKNNSNNNNNKVENKHNNNNYQNRVNTNDDVDDNNNDNKKSNNTAIIRDKHGNVLSEAQLAELDVFMAQQMENKEMGAKKSSGMNAQLTLSALNDPNFKDRYINKENTTSSQTTLHGVGLTQIRSEIRKKVLALMGKDRVKDPSKRSRADLSAAQQTTIKTIDPLWAAQRQEELEEEQRKADAKKREKFEYEQKLQEKLARAIELNDMAAQAKIQQRIIERQQRDYDNMMNATRLEALQVDLRVVRNPITGAIIRRVKKPTYNGSDVYPNRFDIKPGHRWDGVDRSNGWEQERRELMKKK